MISVEAAGLIAQVLPVGTLVLVLESRPFIGLVRKVWGFDGGKAIFPPGKWATHWGRSTMTTLTVLLIAAALQAPLAVFVCILSVVDNSPVDGLAALYVGFVGGLTVVAVGLVFTVRLVDLLTGER